MTPILEEPYVSDSYSMNHFSVPSNIPLNKATTHIQQPEVSPGTNSEVPTIAGFFNELKSYHSPLIMNRNGNLRHITRLMGNPTCLEKIFCYQARNLKQRSGGMLIRNNKITFCYF